MRGLSLIELLVAVAILAVMAGAMVLAFPDLGGRSLDTGAARVHGLIELACERAERSGRDVGIAVGRDRLVFGPFVGAQWRPLPDSPGQALRPRRLPSSQSLALQVDGRALALPETPPEVPQLACLAGGERTPFVLELRAGEGASWRIRAGTSGAIALERGDED